MLGLEKFDSLWILLCAFLVMFMQAGFCCLESGLVRSKNSINVAIKNVADLCISVFFYLTVGFGLMFGNSVLGLFGSGGMSYLSSGDSDVIVVFIFQAMFCGTAATIISGSVAERLRFNAYLLISGVVAILIYPVVGHWVWGGLLPDTGSGWLAKMGFVDFAGSTVVHSTAAWVALAALIVIGPRIGRFGKDSGQLRGHNFPLAALGLFILWLGWFGFNGGSTLAFDANVPSILLNTAVAAAAGGMTGIMLSLGTEGRVNMDHLINAVIAGLVGITAGCHLLSLGASLVVGVGAAVVYYLGKKVLDYFQIDDAICAVPVHGFAGAWGTLAIPIFASSTVLGTGLGRLAQIAVQSVGILACFCWSFGVAWIVFRLVDRIFPLRVDEESERVGLNISEHGVGTETLDLLTKMEEHRESGDFSHAVEVDQYTEAGQIADQYNFVLEKVQEKTGELQMASLVAQESEERFRTVIEKALSAVITLNKEGIVAAWNPRAENIFGWTVNEAMGSSLADLIVPEEMKEAHKIGLQRFVETKQSKILNQRLELKGITKDKRIIDIEICIVDYELGGELFFTAYVDEITERKRLAEELLRTKEEALAASKAKGEFLANMSHEIRTPMNGIVGMIELLEETDDEEDKQDYLNTIKQSTEALATIINDILDISKIEAGKLDLEIIEFSPRSLTEDVADIIAPRVFDKHLEFATHVENEMPAKVLGDPTRIRQILTNLVSNALKFTLNGQIIINAFLQATEDKDLILRFEVCDSGIGIEEDKLAQIFEKFTQADASTTRLYGGTGLGLSICQSLAELMGGEIGAESKRGQGSKFWFTVKVENLCEEDPLKAKGVKDLSRDVLHVLLIDDNAQIRETLLSYLSSWGIQVQAVASFEEGASIVKQNVDRPELIIIESAKDEFDFMNADAIGVSDFLAGLNQHNPKVPVICLSPLGEKLPKEVLDHGVNKKLSKPVKKKALWRVLEDALKVSGPGQDVPMTKTFEEQSRLPNDIRVLAAEDNLINQKLIKRILNNIGCHYDLVGNGIEALTALEAYPYDLVLMDCQMPEMDGYEATREIRARAGEPWSQVPIVAVTANAMSGDRERCLEAGMNDYMTKPYKKSQIVDMLKRWAKPKDDSSRGEFQSAFVQEASLERPELKSDADPSLSETFE